MSDVYVVRRAAYGIVAIYSNRDDAYTLVEDGIKLDKRRSYAIEHWPVTEAGAVNFREGAPFSMLVRTAKYGWRDE